MPELRPALVTATVGEAVREIARHLAAAGIAEPAADARRLVLAAAGLTAETMFAVPTQPLDPVCAARLQQYLSRRLTREPVSRILGVREFYGRTFAVSPATLDPRPDSETLIEAALQLVVETDWSDRPLRILDVGTGTGCLLLTLLAELPRAAGLGTDISVAALEVAQANAARLGLGERARFEVHDLLDGVHEPFDLLVSNPPYIRSREIDDLEPEVRDFDPLLALNGGDDGLDCYRRLASECRRVVADGWVLCEVGADQAEAVVAILCDASGITRDCARRWLDLGSHTRCVAIRTHKSSEDQPNPIGIPFQGR